MSETPAKAEEAFYAELWRKLGRDLNGEELARQKILAQAISEYAKGDQLEILDLGCGRGIFSHWLSEFGTVLGIDPTQSSIDASLELFGESEGLSFRACDASELVSEGKTFSLIVCSEVLEHVLDKQPFLNDLESLLGEHGVAIFTTPRREVYHALKKTPGQPVEAWLSEWEFADLAADAGLDVIEHGRFFVPFETDHFPAFVAMGRGLPRFFDWFTRIKRLRSALREEYSVYQFMVAKKRA